MGPPLDTPLSGAKRVRKLNEREREGHGAGLQRGVSGERKF